MSRRTLIAVGGAAAGGAVGSLVLAAAAGMPGNDVLQLAVLLLPAVGGSVAITAIAERALARASFRRRLVAVTLAGIAVAMVNLVALALLMFVSGHDALVMAILLAYAAIVGIASGLALARKPTVAVAHLAATAATLARGDLDARAGPVGGGPELEALARSMDEMAERVQASRSREREAEALRRDLITAVSHDLRTPLAGLQAMSEAIQDGVVEDPPTLRRYATEISRAVGSLAALVDDLFELTQLDPESIRQETRRARLADVVASAVAACGPQATEKGLRVETHLGGADGALCSPRLVRVLQNLLQNAIRHTPADGSVRVEAQQGPEGLEVVVQDTGEGIAPEALSRVFDPFWRGDAARASPGSGLGLALSRRIVRALGGDIRVESERDRGSRFALLVRD
jgi:signal transduction histidine kinase